MNPLDQMKDIHLPPEVSFWPIAYGWWLLLVAVVLTIFFTARWIITNRQINKARRQALTELSQLTADEDWPHQLNALLKRTALSYFDNAQVASLHTHQWVEFLCQQVHEDKRSEFQQTFSQLQQSLYAKSTNHQAFEQCKASVQEWIKSISVKRSNLILNKRGNHV